MFDTNKYAPGPHPYTYGGFSGRQFQTNDTGANILCYKFLNTYQMRTPQWVKAQTFKLRHHKGCNFDLFYVTYDAKKLKPKNPWRDAGKEDPDNEKDEDEDEKKEEEAEEEGDDNEKEGKKPAPSGSDDEKPDEDEKPKQEPKKGELNPEFGLYVERPFYVKAKLSTGRYLDIVGNSLVIKTLTYSDTQIFWFDQKTKTIKSQGKAGTSWDIASAGRSTNMQVWRTNAGWFQIFKYEQDYLMNLKSKKVLEVSGGLDVEGQKVVVNEKEYSIAQKWSVIYVEDAEKA